MLVMAGALLRAQTDNIGGDVSASFPEAGAQALTGALAGASVETSSGVFRATLNFSMPLARGVSQPGLALTYSSAAGVRDAGVGWGLPLPTIERKASQGPPRLKDDLLDLNADQLLFNGERIVAICEVGAALKGCGPMLAGPTGSNTDDPLPTWAVGGTRYYRLEVDNHARLFWMPSRSTWRVQYPGGEILEFGQPTVAKIGFSVLDPDASIDYDELLSSLPQPAIRKTVVVMKAPFRWNLVARYTEAPGGTNNLVVYRWAKLGATGRGYLTDVYYTPPVVEGRLTDSRFTEDGFAHHIHLRWQFIPQAGNRFTPIWRATPDYTLAGIDVASKPFGSASAPREMVRRYHLTYTGNQRPYLVSFQMEGRCSSPVQEAGGLLPLTNCPMIPATTLKWSQPNSNTTPGLLVPNPAFPDPAPDGWRVIPIDINADGLPDLIETGFSFKPDNDRPYDAYGALRSGTTRVWVQGSAFFNQTTVDGPVGLLSQNGYTFTGDFTATGETGAVLYTPNTTRSCGIAPGSPCGPPYQVLPGSAYKAVPLGTTAGTLKFGWEPDTISAVQLGKTANEYRVEAVGDINGDGVPDLLDAHSDKDDSGPTDTARIDIRLGGRNAGKSASTFGALPSTCLGPSRDMMKREDWMLDAPMPVALADMNGDGLADLVLVGPQTIEYWPGDGRGNFMACRSAGCNCSEMGAETPGAKMFSPMLGPITMSRGWRLVDLNGDGYADLVALGFDGIRIFYNIEGFAFTPPVFLNGPSLFPKSWSAVKDGTKPLNISFADMNGNGITDLVLQVDNQVQTIDLHQITYPARAFAPDAYASRPGLLIGIENGLGAKTEVSYLTTAQLAQIAIANGTPWAERIPQVLQVVGRITVTSGVPGVDPIRVSYDYDDPAWDGFERQFRGFRIVTATRLGTNSVSTTTHFFIPVCPVRQCWSTEDTYLILKAAAGAPYLTETFDSDGKYLSTVSRSYKVVNFRTAVDGTPVRFAYASVVDRRVYDTNDWTAGDGVSTVEIGLGDRTIWKADVPIRSPANVLLRSTQVADVNGNVTHEVDCGRIKDDGTQIDDPITRDIVYYPARSDWKFLTFVNTTYAFPSRPRVPDDIIRRGTYSFDAAGRLIEIKHYLGGTMPLDRRHQAGKPIAPPPPNASADGVWVSLGQYDYDDFDNMIQMRGPNGRCQHVFYDTDYADLAQRIERYRSGCGVGGIATRQYWDRGLQIATEVTEANGTTSRTTFDGYGRPLTVWLPDGTTGAAQSDPWAVFTYQDVPGGPAQKAKVEVKDSTGRTHTAWSYVDGLGQPLLTLTEADPIEGDVGAWVARGLPKLGTGNQVVGTYQPWFYNGDPGSHPLTPPATPMTATLRDSFDRVVEVTRPDGTLATHYTYRPLSVESKDASGRWTRNSLDGHGRQREWRARGEGTDEVVMGATYQVGGEAARILQWHTQGMGVYVSRWMKYDSLGRMVLNAEPNTSIGFDDNPAAATAMHAWRYAYDDAGDLVGTSDARGCGRNFHYDSLGRAIAEDYSPCLATHAPYTPVNLATGAGAEVFNRYDAPDPGQTTDYGVSVANLIGHLVSTRDRAALTRFAYDWRGQQIGLARLVTKPADASAVWPEGVPTPDDRYATEWFRRATQFDNSGQMVAYTTGATTAEMTDAAGKSEIVTWYSSRRLLTGIFGTYGSLLENVLYDADGRTNTLAYGDIANSSSKFGYDTNRRLISAETSRLPATLWTAGAPNYTPPAAGDPPTMQTVIAQFTYGYDPAGFLNSVQDLRKDGDWPAGAKPVSLKYSYNEIARLLRTDYIRAAADPSVTPPVTDNAIPDAVVANRPVFQTFTYDTRGNLIAGNDDAGSRYDRSLGTVVNGSTAAGPDQLVSSASGAITAKYDEAGNLVDLIVKRSGPCSDAGSRCSHRLVYDWDEAGRLARARRWDYDTIPATEPVYPSLPASQPDADLHYRYDAGGYRVIKSAVAADGSQSHTAYIFDTLRLERANYNGATLSYDHTAATEVVTIPGIGRVLDRPGLPRVGNSDRHVLIDIADHLGSSIATIDHATSELVERATYQSYGAAESDYRPARWNAIPSEEQFTGKDRDAEVGLVYFGARYYHPWLGRWMSADPQSIHGLSSDLNPYAYVRGSPSRLVDPVGLDGEGGCLGAEKCGPNASLASDPSYDYDPAIDGPRDTGTFSTTPVPVTMPTPTPDPAPEPATIPFWQALGSPQYWPATVDPAVVQGFNAGVEKNQTALVGTGITAAASGALLSGMAAVEIGGSLLSGAVKGLQGFGASLYVNAGRAAQWFSEFGLAQQGITVGGGAGGVAMMSRLDRAQQIQSMAEMESPYLAKSTVAVGDMMTRSGVWMRLIAVNRADMLKWMMNPKNLKLNEGEYIVPLAESGLHAEVNLGNWALRNGFMSGPMASSRLGCDMCVSHIVSVFNMLKGASFTHDNPGFTIVEILLNPEFF